MKLLPKVLIVDDDLNVLEALKRTLKTDFHVLISQSPKEALALLEKNPDVAIVIADEVMPEGSGINLLIEVRTLYPKIVRVILSGQVKVEQMMLAVNRAEIHRFLTKPWENHVLRIQLQEAFLQHTELAEIHDLKMLAITDPLTGVANRRFFEERSKEEFERSSRHQRVYSLIMVDVDHFKSINESFGHKGGDQTLKEIAQFLKNSTRLNDCVARYGGDEFAIILPETTKQSAIEVCERMKTHISELHSQLPDRFPGKLSLSFGIASFPEDGSTYSEILESADKRLFKAKSAGRNTVVGK